MAFKRPWLEFSLGRDDENAVYWWLFEAVLHGRSWRDSQIETFLTSSGWIQLSGGADILKERYKNVWMPCLLIPFCVFVFLLPLFAPSSSNEPGWHSPDAVSFCSWRQYQCFVCGVGVLFSDTVVHLHLCSVNQPKNLLNVLSFWRLGGFAWVAQGVRVGRRGRYRWCT